MMIQDIAPHVFDNHMQFDAPQESDAVLVFNEGDDVRFLDVMVREGEGDVVLPSRGSLGGDIDLVFAFSVDDRRFFLALPGHGITTAPEGWTFRRAGFLDRIAPHEAALAIMTGVHLYRWYAANRFCGRCGSALAPKGDLRALTCASCGNMVFPKIAPVVIVALVSDGRLLTIRYAGPRGTHRALVAGFVEIGETAEQAVEREILEETGLHAKNIRYVCSQPWGFNQELILGYTAELDGSDAITIDEDELADAAWTVPDEIEEIAGNPSLTYELMRRVKHGLL